MANDISVLAPMLFSVAQEVASEPAESLDAINLNFNDKGVAVGEDVTVPVAPARDDSEYVPAMSTSEGDDAEAEAVKVKITANRKVSWKLTGEQQTSLENAASDKEWIRQMIAQGMRTLRNKAEIDLVATLKVGASRAFGTPSSTPFASDLSALTNARKILRDNGAPMADLQAVINTDSSLNMMNLNIYQQAQMSGSDAERRSGQFKPQFGFQIRESAGIVQHVKGSGANYAVNNSEGYAKGAKNIAVDTGTGTILPGDVVTFGGGSVKHVVGSALSGGGFGINNPGLLASVADDAAVAVGNSYTPNFAFERAAVVGVMRPPRIPQNANIQQLKISDKFGRTYLLVQISGDGMITWRLHLCWGFKVVQPEFVALMLG